MATSIWCGVFQTVVSPSQPLTLSLSLSFAADRVGHGRILANRPAARACAYTSCSLQPRLTLFPCVFGAGNAFNHEVIESADQLADCFAYVFPRCQGTERFVSNSTLFKQLVDAAMQTAGVKVQIDLSAVYVQCMCSVCAVYVTWLP